MVAEYANINKIMECHESAIIDTGASIGKRTKVWHWSHICSGAIIGEDCSIGQNVFVGGKASIGNNVKIQNNVSVYDKVKIEDNVFCGPSVVFTNVINPRAEVNRKSEYKATIIREGVSLGANSTIVCGVKIGKYAFIGAGAVVTRNVKDYALIVGVPGKQVGWMDEYGERIELPIEGSGTWTDERGCVYQLKEGEISRVR